MKKRVAVLISGNGSNLQALIDACKDPSFPAEIVRVISNNEQAFGLQRAHKAGIDTLVIDHRGFPDRESFDQALHEALAESEAELVCLAGFMRILTSEFVAKWQGCMINIHPSLLPAYKGLHTHQRVLDDGIKFTGCTVHFVVPEMDAGPTIIQAAVPVGSNDTEPALAARVLEQEHLIYPQALKWLASDQLEIKHGVVQNKSAPDCSSALIHPSLDAS